MYVQKSKHSLLTNTKYQNNCTWFGNARIKEAKKN